MENKFKILKSIDTHKNIMIEVDETGEEIEKIREINREGIVSYWIYAPEEYKNDGELHATGGYLDFEEAKNICDRLNKYMKEE